MLKVDRIRFQLPHLAGALLHLMDDILRRIVRRPARGKRGPAAAGNSGEADRIRIDDRRLNVRHRDPQHFRRLHRNRGPRSADVGGAFD